MSKCVDEQVRCVGGLSAKAIGDECAECGLCPKRPAYETDELTDRFDELGQSRPTAWYAERNDDGITMAALAWKARPQEITAERYADVLEMGDWMADRLGSEPVMWLDDVFANRRLKQRGNLRNFGAFVVGLATILDCETAAYRTIEPRMTAAPKRDFGDRATVATRRVDVPDRRDFIVINNVREAL